MKKILFSLFVTFCFVNQSISATHSSIYNTQYCRILNASIPRQATCYWCKGGGSTPPGNCKQGYAGCEYQTEQYVNVGSTFDNFRCTSEGVCELSCSETRWNNTGNGYDVLQQAAGCLCNEYITTTTYRCSSGYYGTGKNCSRCPAVDSTVYPLEYGYSHSGTANESITDCYISGIEGEYFYDRTGTFEIYTSSCHYKN